MGRVAIYNWRSEDGHLWKFKSMPKQSIGLEAISHEWFPFGFGFHSQPPFSERVNQGQDTILER